MTTWISVKSEIRPYPGAYYNVTIKLKDGKKFTTTLQFTGGDEWRVYEIILLDEDDYEITHWAELPEPA